MKRTVPVLASILFSILAAAAASAQGVQIAPPTSLPSLKSLDWMTGRWVDDSNGELSEEIWAAPAGDSMMGMWRHVVGGKVQIFEILSIKLESDGIVLRLRHFDPKLVGREEKDRPVDMTLVGWKENEARFEGRAAGAGGGGLVALTYRRVSGDTLTCTLEKEGKKQEFSFRKAS